MTFIPVDRSEVAKYGITQAIVNQLIVSKVTCLKNLITTVI